MSSPVSQIMDLFQLVPGYLTEIRTEKNNFLYFHPNHPIKFDPSNASLLKKKAGLIYWSCRQIKKSRHQLYVFLNVLLLVPGRMFSGITLKLINQHKSPFVSPVCLAPRFLPKRLVLRKPEWSGQPQCTLRSKEGNLQHPSPLPGLCPLIVPTLLLSSLVSLSQN